MYILKFGQTFMVTVNIVVHFRI